MVEKAEQDANSLATNKKEKHGQTNKKYKEQVSGERGNAI